MLKRAFAQVSALQPRHHVVDHLGSAHWSNSCGITSREMTSYGMASCGTAG